jgi:hypothetical protein
MIFEAHGVRKGVHRERVLGCPLHAEEVDLGPEREHEVVVAQRFELGEANLVAVEVDRRDLVLVDADIFLLVEEIPDRVSDCRLFEQAGRDLVEERLEGVVVVLVDDHHIDVALAELLGGPDPSETSPQHNDAGAASVRVMWIAQATATLRPSGLSSLIP